MSEAEHHERSRRLVESPERARDVFTIREPLDGRELLARLFVDAVTEVIGTPSLASQPVGAAVSRDGQEPGPRRGLVAKLVHRHERARERVLRQVLGDGGIAHHRAAEPLHLSGVIAHQERGGIAGSRALQELPERAHDASISRDERAGDLSPRK